MHEKINEIERYFLFYGWLKCPLNRKKIVSLILRGFSKDQIYEFGCDLVYFYNAK
tara:strand:- start:87 stop:251 length:165 start_codon:yes stop_codon:yes gene_type:complete